MASSDAGTMFEYLLLSVLSGLLSSGSYQVVSYGEAQGEELQGWRKVSLDVANYVLGFGGVGVFILASNLGPVSVCMPAQTAASLLLNMIVQYCGGIKHFTKTMIAGTLILAAAALCLIFVGPTDPPSGSIDVIKLVSSTLAEVWLCCNVLLLLGSFAFLMCSRSRSVAAADASPLSEAGTAAAPKAPKESGARMLAYALLVAESTALGATIGKMITVSSGGILACCFFFYFLAGLGTMVGGNFASHVCDVAVYLPISQCVQLAVNGATGLFVWGDAPRVQSPVLYACVYGLVFLCVFLCSEIDCSKLSRQQSLLGGDQETNMAEQRVNES